MPFTPDAPFPKGRGDGLRSKDWNDLVNEVLRIDADKMNQDEVQQLTQDRVSKAGDAMQGPLTIDGNLGVGTTNPLAKLTVDGSIIRRVAVATGLGPTDQTDNGQIVSRVLNFTKLYEDTAIRILYCDNFRIMGDATRSRWEIRVNGTPPPGGEIYQAKHNSGGNYHDPATIIGYATGLPAGDHQIQIWIRPPPGSPVGDAFTGWNDSRWTIEAEEVWIQ